MKLALVQGGGNYHLGGWKILHSHGSKNIRVSPTIYDLWSHLWPIKFNHNIVVLLNNLSWMGTLNIITKNAKYFIVEKESALVEDTEI